MKRLIILLICAITSVTVLNAQSIIGTWTWSTNDGTVYMTFKESNNGLLHMVIPKELAPGVTLKFVVSTDFTYAVEGGKSVMYKINYDNIKTDLDCVFSGKAKEAFAQKGITEKDFVTQPEILNSINPLKPKIQQAVPLAIPAVATFQITYLKNGIMKRVNKSGNNPMTMKSDKMPTITALEM